MHHLHECIKVYFFFCSKGIEQFLEIISIPFDYFIKFSKKTVNFVPRLFRYLFCVLFFRIDSLKHWNLLDFWSKYNTVFLKHSLDLLHGYRTWIISVSLLEHVYSLVLSDVRLHFLKELEVSSKGDLLVGACETKWGQYPVNVQVIDLDDGF